MWICSDCGHRYGKSRFHVSTFHFGQCQWCQEHKPVTEDRDFGYPRLPSKRKRKRNTEEEC